MAKAKPVIFIGADHAGFRQKEYMKAWLQQQGYVVKDLGAKTLDPNDDYPDYAIPVAKAVAKNKNAVGILCCGSAEGVAIAANKVKGIRAVAVWKTRDAKLTRQHNDANVLCLSGWYLPHAKAKVIAKAWLTTHFSGAPRHKRRIEKIAKFEKKP